jgi:hypothetical protein
MKGATMYRFRRNGKNLGAMGRTFRTAALAALAIAACANVARAEKSIFDDDWTPPSTTEAPKKSAAPIPSALPSSTTPPAAAAALPSGPSSPSATAPKPKPAPKTVAPQPKTPAVEPDPRAEYEKVFGAQEKKVLATPGTKDDAEFGMMLVETARKVTDSPKLQAFLYEKAADMAAKDPSGYSVALEALDALVRLRPAQATAPNDKYLVVCQKQYLAASPADKRPLADPYRSKLMQVASAKAALGSYTEAIALCRKAADVARVLGPDEVAEVTALSKQIGERQVLAKHVTELEQKLAGGASDPASAREVAGLLAGALEQPAQAAAYLPAAADPALTQCVNLTKAPPSSLTDAQVLQLGDWYKSLAAKTEKTTPLIASSLLQRAEGAYHRYLSLHSVADASNMRATVAVADIGKELDRIGRPATQTTFLLSRVIPQKHQVSGHWQMTDEGVLIGDANVSTRGACLVIPVKPQGNYEMSIVFQSDGASDVGFTLPVGNSSVSLLWEQRSAGLYFVNGSVVWFARDKLPLLTADRNQHLLYAKVLTKGDLAGVLVMVDGAEIGRWEGAAADLMPLTEFESPDSKLPALDLWTGRAGFFSASLHMLSGTVERVDVDASKPAVAAAGGVARPGRIVPGLVGAGSRASSDMPADGSRPADAMLNGDYVYHDLATLTYSKSNQGDSLVKIEFAAPTDEVGFVLRGLPSLVANPDFIQIRINAHEFQRLVALSKEAPRGFTDEQASNLLKLHDAWLSASASDKPAAEHALFAAVHELGEGYRKLGPAWVDYVRQNTSDEEYQAILKQGRFGYAP